MAYTNNQIWQALLDETAWSTIQLRDRRYEAVVHLVTAADGKPKFYTSENNEARYETIEEAIALGRLTAEDEDGGEHTASLHLQAPVSEDGHGQRCIGFLCLGDLCLGVQEVNLATPTIIFGGLGPEPGFSLFCGSRGH